MVEVSLSAIPDVDLNDLAGPVGRLTTVSCNNLLGEVNSTDDGSENNDFLALLTCATGLYAQEQVLPMSTTSSPGAAVDGQGALGLVTRLHANYSQPSNQQSNEVDKIVINCAAKRYVGGGRGDYLGSLLGGSSSGSLWDEYGCARNTAEARSFVMELRVLSHPDIRNSGKVVKIRGLSWDNIKAGAGVSHLQQLTNRLKGTPTPIILMERASCNLSEFLSQSPSLPIHTKWRLALDIATGISILHRCGVIHGDIKPDNILIFEVNRSYHAKVADFSHSILDTGAFRCLAGGTDAYAAPEWREEAETRELKLTDIYSFGLTFACLMAGKDLFAEAHRSGRGEEMRQRKYLDTMDNYLRQELLSLNDPNLDDQNTMLQILSLTIQKIPKARDLNQVLSMLWKVTSTQDSRKLHMQKIGASLGSTETLAIPHQALANMPPQMHRHVLRVLTHMAGKKTGPRAAAAAFELAACYCSGVGVFYDNEVSDSKTQANALYWLTLAAQRGDQRARITMGPVHEAFGSRIPSNVPIQDWLIDLAENYGSTTALDQLARINPPLYREALHRYRQTYCGADQKIFNRYTLKDASASLPTALNHHNDTILHCAAATGNLHVLQRLSEEESFSKLINERNIDGDTALIQAMRAGHAEVAMALIRWKADARITNNVDESPLHFLVNLDEKDVLKVSGVLLEAGTALELQQKAQSLTCTGFDSSYIPSRGTPALRAVCRNNAIALRALFDMEDSITSRNHHGKTAAAILVQLIFHALRLHHTHVLEVLKERLGSQFQATINVFKLWHDNDLRTLFQACVFGPVSTNEISGFNYPERFTRIARFGKDYRKVLTSCFDFLVQNGAEVKEDGILSFAIAHNRRDAISELAVYAADLRLWARLTIRPPRHEIFHDLLEMDSLHLKGIGTKDAGPSFGFEDNNFALLFLAQIYLAGLDPVMLSIYIKWLRTSCCPRSTRWVPLSVDEEVRLRTLANPTNGRGRSPWCLLLWAYESNRLDLVHILFEFGASLQDKMTNGDTVFEAILGGPNPKPEQMAEILGIAVSYESQEIVTIKDITRILLARCCLPLGDIPTGAAPESAATWTQEPDDLPLLEWPSLVKIQACKRLWENLGKAIGCQKALGEDMKQNLQHNLMLHAAQESNLAAIRCLLDMGIHPDGNRLDCPVWGLDDITPLDVVRWSSCVPDKRCTESGLELKRTNQAIVDLLLEHQATHGRAYSRIYQWILLPCRELHLEGMFILWIPMACALYISFATALGALSIWMFNSLRAEIREAGWSSSYAWGIWINLLMPIYDLLIWYYFVQALRIGLRNIIMGPKRRRLIEAAFGGSKTVFVAAQLSNSGRIGRFLARRIGLISKKNASQDDSGEGAALLDGMGEDDSDSVQESIGGHEAGEGQDARGAEPYATVCSPRVDARDSTRSSRLEEFEVEDWDYEGDEQITLGRRRTSRLSRQRWAERGRRFRKSIGGIVAKRVIPVAAWSLEKVISGATAVSAWSPLRQETQRQGYRPAVQ